MLADLLERGELVVSIYGLGYVGLALSAAWLRAGARVIGVDVDAERVAAISNGVVEYVEEDVKRTIEDAVRSGRMEATVEGDVASIRSRVKIVAVPVYLRSTRPSVEVDFSAISAAAKAIAQGLKQGDLVIIESSVPPGTTEEVVRPILETSGLTAEEDFYLAYSPERIMVGHALKDIEENYPKVIAGVGPKSAEEAATLYRKIARRGVIVLSSVKAAEFEKLLEGVYRDVNIALANEMAYLANALGISFAEAREAANSQPYSHVHKPGTGVGGSCIPVYPYFLIWTAERLGLELPLTLWGRRINEEQPFKIAEAVVKAMIREGVDPSRAKVAVLGLAFRGDVDDTRRSPSYDVIRGLLDYGIKNIVVHDPFVKRDALVEKWGLRLTQSLEEALRGAEVAVIATDHSAYRVRASELARYMKKPLIVDARGVLKRDIQVYSIDGGRWPIKMGEAPGEAGGPRRC
ncbi:nucleotide sugar dehydrogenase [Thermoproteus tenax]|uniref:UDP-N-acetyl-D-mannosamine dehydrogenase n=1 Tax=Thermoproteus tenax (strain ATCC 35583 / DSM 2078 / JCM 9277 / NBRC 100435 / Kra 1) TaxID=768679 RepID=G4RLF2_THETK|nr:nucleotide sugar dehydrogenase [Thermoproteus tenax]CCC82397.1 UDP-N-acetyl-D-mannosaminuronic acid dehydrogenase [Thermoproteus tenax Kra 1]